SSVKVSALVVSSKRGEHLIECLNHLSTQIVNFDFEIAVWDILNDQNKRDILQSLFSGVRDFSQEEGDPLPTAFFRALDKLKGDYILLLSDDILLHQDAVDKLHHAAMGLPDRHVFFPRIDWQKRNFFGWGKRKFSLKSKQLITKALGRTNVFSYKTFKEDKARWVYSECFFAHRNSFFYRDFISREQTQKNLFLWKYRKPAPIFRYVSEVVVFKKE
ncbi:MAG: glycosyltransferase, partial [Candidatus Aminicenantes bacterium]|nr:glycosyltransferase [Candidatus Aminicenantes bacterium]